MPRLGEFLNGDMSPSPLILIAEALSGCAQTRQIERGIHARYNPNCCRAPLTQRRSTLEPPEGRRLVECPKQACACHVMRTTWHMCLIRRNARSFYRQQSTL